MRVDLAEKNQKPLKQKESKTREKGRDRERKRNVGSAQQPKQKKMQLETGGHEANCEKKESGEAKKLGR